MPAPRKHREPIVDAAISLFRQGGYYTTGVNAIAKTSGAPKGSVYHYFPEGKRSIAIAAVEEEGRRLAELMQVIADQSSSAGDFLCTFAATVGEWLAHSGYRDACPMMTVMLELAPDDRHVTKAGVGSYSGLLSVIERCLVKDGYDEIAAAKIATLWLTSLLGAHVQARVCQSPTPLITVAEMLVETLAPPSANARR